MKKILIPDEYICAFFSAMGYGFGYSVPAAFGLPGWLCLVICFAAGLSLEQVAIKIIYSRFTQEKKSRKMLIFAAFFLIFLVGNFVSVKLYEQSLFVNLEEEFGYVLLFELAGFLLSLIKQRLRMAKVKAKYGNAEEGFRYTSKEKAYIEGLNQNNAEITGEYDRSLCVKTRTGIYVGQKEQDILSFYGIPYAKAPVGELRWKAPEALPDCEKVFEAQHYGPSAIQVNYKGNPLSFHRQSEDCLYLNICTAKTPSGGKKPVIVILHGGDFSYGGSADPLWEMENLVKNHPDVVTVSFNYRLGLLGFIDFSAVNGGEKYPDTKYLGLLDQIAALTWIRENIAAFGGDPEQITVMGAGSGGTSISLLTASECARGLFGKAVLLSASSPLLSKIQGNAPADLAAELCKAAGAENMEELAAIPEEKIALLTQALKDYLVLPVCDGKLIPEDIFALYRNGAAREVQFTLCTSRDNTGVYSSKVGRGFSEKMITEAIDQIFAILEPEEVKKLKTWLDDQTERLGKAKAEAKFINLWLDQGSLIQLSEALHNGGSTVRTLYWDVDALIKELGVGNVNMVSTLLGNHEAAEVYGSVVDDNIRKILQELLLKAVRGEATELYTNEVDGIDAIKWEIYPGILTVKKKSVQMEPIEEALSDAVKLIRP